MNGKEKGFGIVEVLISSAVVVTLGFIGWQFFSSKQQSSQKSSNTSQFQPASTPSPSSISKRGEDETPKATATSPVRTPSQQVTATSPTQQAPAAPTAKPGRVYEIYRIAADGNSAQISPVITTLTDVSSVELTVDLQCPGSCRFKLISDSYNFSDSSTYTSSQKVNYIISKPGEYIFYNQFTPNTKFKIKF